MNGCAEFDVRWATADLWDDVEGLFGRGGASNGCWCQYWLLGPGYHRRDRARNRQDLADQVDQGRAGLLAYCSGLPVGWVRFTPRSDLAWLAKRFPGYDFSVDDPWALSCFFVARHARGAGVMAALIDFAVQWAHDQHASVEAYPIDPTVEGATRNLFPGVLSTFLAAGFTERGRLAIDRAVVRCTP